MIRPILPLALCGAAALAAEPGFRKIQLSDRFWAEGANFGDFNHDGKPDLVAGPYWWEGPDFKVRHRYDSEQRRSPAGTAPHPRKDAEGQDVETPGFAGAGSATNAYSDNFLVFARDFNADGWDDILVLGFPGEPSFWHENLKGKEGEWPKHRICTHTDNESPAFDDLTGDGNPELIFHTRLDQEGKPGAFLGYATPDPANPTGEWTFHKLSPAGGWDRFHHGLGHGDVNGDGRSDYLMQDGWREQPASLEGDPEWTFHPADFGPGGSQMYAYDVNGDGRNDVITALAAHGHGLAWHEQLEDGSFRRHLIMGSTPEESAGGVVFTQPHAVDLVDIDGDGLKDIVTGKRFWAHGPDGDIDPNAPAVLYWYQLKRNPDGGVEFIPHKIDDSSGVGTQVVARDANGDGRPDIAVANKNGIFLFLQEAAK